MNALDRIKNLIACGGGTVWVCQIVPELAALVKRVEQAEQQTERAEKAEREHEEATLWEHTK